MKKEILSEIWKTAKGKLCEASKQLLTETKEFVLERASQKACALRDESVASIKEHLSGEQGKLNLEEPMTVEVASPKELRLQTKEPEAQAIEATDSFNEDTFVEDLTGRLRNVGLQSISNPAEAIAVVNTLVNCAKDVQNFQELQITKRLDIERLRQEGLAKIEMQKQILTQYLEKTFDERAEIFKRQFEAIDIALEGGNVELLATTLRSVNELASSCPFKSLGSIKEVSGALNDKRTEWDF